MRKVFAAFIITILSLTAYASADQALFKLNKPPTIRISINSTPVETNSGFMRLAGIISGDTPMALIEVGGKGSLVKAGDIIADYKVKSIFEKEVKLCIAK